MLATTLSADVVTADGQLLTTNASENADVFWGLRGAGANFGVVTSFEYRLHRVGKLLAGPVFYPFDQTGKVLRFYRELTAGAPDGLTADFGVIPDPNGQTVAAIALCYCGDLQGGEKVLRGLRRFASPIVNQIQPTNYLDIQSLFDALYQPRFFHYWKSNFLRDLSDAAIETIIVYAGRKPTPMSHVVIEHFHGAAQRALFGETAFANRDHEYDLLIIAMSPNSADSEKNMRWAREFWEAMQPYSAGRAYVNYLTDEGQERLREAYGPNYERLVALKTKYDPTNFFRHNHNIRPQTEAERGAA
ncbi:MAG: BBE domain-containing protein [Acidobacteriales bacterium]|nr:BBE domain-containing protein [Terriglobales bacterium]